MDVINATGSITAVHQNHDFSHLPGGKIHRKQTRIADNLALASGRESMFTLYDTIERSLKARLSLYLSPKTDVYGAKSAFSPY
jgi:hypothetical protein